MASNRTFYRTVMTVEILSEAPLSGDESLSDIVYLIEDGPCSGKVETVTENEKVDGPRMAQLLQDQASDTAFFGLDEEGNDLDGDDEEELDSEGEEDGEEHINHLCSIGNEKVVLCRGHVEARRVNGQVVEEGSSDEGACQDCYEEKINEAMTTDEGQE